MHDDGQVRRISMNAPQPRSLARGSVNPSDANRMFDDLIEETKHEGDDRIEEENEEDNNTDFMFSDLMERNDDDYKFEIE